MKKKFYLCAALIIGVSMGLRANPNPPLLLLDDDEEGVVEKTASTLQQSQTTSTSLSTPATSNHLQSADDDEDVLLLNSHKDDSAEKARNEKARIAKEKEEQKRLANEQKEQERLAKKQERQEQLAKEKEGRERIRQEKKEQKRLANEQKEQERLAKKQERQEQLAKEKEERERLAKEKENKQTDQNTEAKLEEPQTQIPERTQTVSQSPQTSNDAVVAKVDSLSAQQRDLTTKVEHLIELYQEGNNSTPQQNPTPKQVQQVKKQETDQQEPEQQESVKKTVFQRYYDNSGENALSIISIGYSTYFLVGQQDGIASTQDAFKRHLINFEIFEWRAKWLGMQMFNFEVGVNSPTNERPLLERGGATPDARLEAQASTMWFAYKPALKFYIPCTPWLAVELYGGAEVDLCQLWSMMYANYYQDISIPEQNFFVGAFGGAGLVLSAIPQIPLEIKAEYRHPVKGNYALVPQGIYISAQVHLATPIHPKKKKQTN